MRRGSPCKQITREVARCRGRNPNHPLLAGWGDVTDPYAEGMSLEQSLSCLSTCVGCKRRPAGGAGQGLGRALGVWGTGQWALVREFDLQARKCVTSLIQQPAELAATDHVQTMRTTLASPMQTFAAPLSLCFGCGSIRPVIARQNLDAERAACRVAAAC